MKPQDEALSVTQELKPCPFCDGEACLREYDEEHPFEPFGLIVDHREDCFLHYSRPFDEIVTAWNTRLSHSTPGDAEVGGYGQAITDVLAILRPNWGVDQHTFRCNGELLKDGDGNSKFFATVDVERAVVERIKQIEALATPSGRAQGEVGQ